MVYIIAIRTVTDGHDHEHIEYFKWEDRQTGKSGDSTRQQMIEWIEGGGVAKVTDGQVTVGVAVVNGPVPYLRTHADGRWTNNLLALPRF